MAVQLTDYICSIRKMPLETGRNQSDRCSRCQNRSSETNTKNPSSTPHRRPPTLRYSLGFYKVENPKGNTTVVKYHSTTTVSSTGLILSRLLGDAGPIGRLHYGGLWARRGRRVVTLEMFTGMELVHESIHLSTRQRRSSRQQQSVALGPSL